MRVMLIAALTIAALVVGALVLKSRAAAAEMLKEGQQAPAFDSEIVVGDQVKPVKLADFKGRKLVLYFYPKDGTPGCTKEACAFRDGFARFDKAGVAVIGCSVDTAEAHKAFIKKYTLPFPLLLDPDKKIATAYGAADGIPILGLDRRITYVIDEQGKIVKVFPEVDPATHAGEILKVIDSIGSVPKPPPANSQTQPAQPSS